MTIASQEIEITDRLKIGGDNPFFLIAGPCVIESEDHVLRMAEEIRKSCDLLGAGFIFKASFDKANRSSIDSYRGPGLDKGLEILSKVRRALEVPILSDVHETSQVEAAAEVLDVIQIPAFLSRQTDLILCAAQTQRPLNIKKGQFLSPLEVKNVIDKALSRKNSRLILTERGTSFGYNNLVFDVRSIPIMKQWGFPVVIDASHSVQRPGGEGHVSGGEAGFIPFIARAGVSAGTDGVFLEVHDNPSKALSDGFNSLNLKELHNLLASLLRIRKALEAEGPAER